MPSHKYIDKIHEEFIRYQLNKGDIGYIGKNDMYPDSGVLLYGKGFTGTITNINQDGSYTLVIIGFDSEANAQWT